MSNTVMPGRVLRGALQLDAAASGVMGLLCLGGGSILQPLLGLPYPLLSVAGIICVGWGIFLGVLGLRQKLGQLIIWGVIALNAVWVIASLGLLIPGWVEPTGLGYAFVIAQAVAVAIFTQLQFIGLKRAGRVDLTAA
jgi:hypothetical protein